MKELVEYIVKSIASHPEEVKVTEEDEDRGLDISLHNEQGYYSEV